MYVYIKIYYIIWLHIMCVLYRVCLYNAYAREVLKCREEPGDLPQCHHLYISTFRYRRIRLLVLCLRVTCGKPQCLAGASVPNIHEMNLFSPQVSLDRAKNSLCNDSHHANFDQRRPQTADNRAGNKEGIRNCTFRGLCAEFCWMARLPCCVNTKHICLKRPQKKCTERRVKDNKKTGRSHPHWETHERRPRPFSFVYGRVMLGMILPCH